MSGTCVCGHGKGWHDRLLEPDTGIEFNPCLSCTCGQYRESRQ